MNKVIYSLQFHNRPITDNIKFPIIRPRMYWLDNYLASLIQCEGHRYNKKYFHYKIFLIKCWSLSKMNNGCLQCAALGSQMSCYLGTLRMVPSWNSTFKGFLLTKTSLVSVQFNWSTTVILPSLESTTHKSSPRYNMYKFIFCLDLDPHI